MVFGVWDLGFGVEGLGFWGWGLGVGCLRYGAWRFRFHGVRHTWNRAQSEKPPKWLVFYFVSLAANRLKPLSTACRNLRTKYLAVFERGGGRVQNTSLFSRGWGQKHLVVFEGEGSRRPCWFQGAGNHAEGFNGVS